MLRGLRSSCVAVALAACTSAMADQVWINSSRVHIEHVHTVAEYGYALSPTNAEMSSVYRWTQPTGLHASQNLGGTESLSGRAFDFSLQHILGEGYIFSLRDTVTQEVSVISWGTFLNHPYGNQPPQANEHSFQTPFNALVLTAQASSEQSSIEFSNLVFSSVLTVADGAFESGFASTPGEETRVQRLVSSVNLASINWTLSGTILGIRDSLLGGAGVTAFTIGQAQAQMSMVIIPLPTPLTMGAAGLGLIMFLARRRRVH